MKKSVCFKGIIIIMICSFGIIKGNAATNPYKEYSSFGKNCTWFAWDQVYKKLGIALPGWGNANTWYDYAKKAGFEVGKTPKNKSLVVWQWNEYGHVAYVERTNNNKIYVWDSEGPCYNYESKEYKTCIENGVSEETDRECFKKYAKATSCEYDAKYWQVEGDLIGYIYLDKIPEKTPSQTPTTANTQTELAKPKQDNNANLSSLTITNGTVEFQKDTLKYKVEIPSEITSIEITATPESQKAKIEGVGTHSLNLGTNIIDITVTAEDNTKKTYTLEIYRKDNNANLSTLTIENIEFPFEKEKLEYVIPVENQIDKINIIGTPESPNALIEGLGEYSLNENENIIKITVTAEDNTTKIYQITVQRETKKEEPPKEKLETKFLLPGCILLFLLIIITRFVTIKKKRK